MVRFLCGGSWCSMLLSMLWALVCDDGSCRRGVLWPVLVVFHAAKVCVRARAHPNVVLWQLLHVTLTHPFPSPPPPPPSCFSSPPPPLQPARHWSSASLFDAGIVHDASHTSHFTRHTSHVTRHAEGGTLPGERQGAICGGGGGGVKGRVWTGS